MENYSSIHYSILFFQIIESIRRNEHGILDFIVQDILRNRDFKDLLDREIEIEDPEDPEEPGEDPDPDPDPPGEENAMVIKIDLSRRREDLPPHNTFRLYLSGNGIIQIDWGDGNSLEVDLDTSTDNFYEHKYNIIDDNYKYTVKVYGQEDSTEQELSFGSKNIATNHYNMAIEEIESWGNLNLVSLSGALSHTMDTLTVPNELPSTVTDLSYLLYHSTVSEVINMQNWNTSNVTDMSYMFSVATEFNQDIGGWNTSNVENMEGMFNSAESFNQYIGDWDTSSVENMKSMFNNAKSFDRYIGDWDTSNVNNMEAMFSSAETFNQDIGGWDVTSVPNIANMARMFNNAKNFWQDLSRWCVEKIPDEPAFFNTGAGFQGQGHLQPKWNQSCT